MTRPGHAAQQRPVGASVALLRTSFAATGLLSLPINLLMLTGPVFMLQIYDRVLASGSVPTLVVLGGLVAGLYVFYGLLEGIRARVLTRLGQRLDARLSGTTYDVSTSLPLVLGRGADRLDPMRDLEAVRQFLAGPGPSALFDVPWMPVYLGIIFLFHPVLGIVATTGAVVICVLIGLNEALARKPMAAVSAGAISRSAMIEAGRRNAEVVRAMGMAEALRERWNRSNAAWLTAQRLAADRTGLFATAIKTFRFMLQSAVLGTGAWLAIGQEITPGIMIAASIITSRALAPVEQAVTQWRGFLGARQGYARLKQVIDQRPEESERMDLPLPEHDLVLDRVVCGAPGMTEPVLRGISLRLRAGDGLGIIGHTGSGKSTLVRTLASAWSALGGTVRLDGAELSQWSPDRFGEFIGYLPQDVHLFDGTVHENITRFAEDATADDVIAAARLADVHDLIVSLPGGYDTQIGAGGMLLSGGQRQRIALARALYGRPFLVILDEPNSNLDSDGDHALNTAIRALRESGSIVIVVAHRPGALGAVDKVLALQDGRTGAFGPRDEVLKQVLAASPVRAA